MSLCYRADSMPVSSAVSPAKLVVVANIFYLRPYVSIQYLMELKAQSHIIT